MTTGLNEVDPRDPAQESDRAIDLQTLLHPAGAFGHPAEVVCDPDLTLNEKRAILASWASDACAVESAPALRIASPGSKPITFDDVMDALRALDSLLGGHAKPRPRYRRLLADRVPGVFGRKSAARPGSEGWQAGA